MKVVINKCYGGFGLSKKAERLLVRKLYPGAESYVEYETKYSIEFHVDGVKVDTYNPERNSKELVEVVEELGEAANSDYAKLAIIEIPDDVDWSIKEYDGFEQVAEKHRTWE